MAERIKRRRNAMNALTKTVIPRIVNLLTEEDNNSGNIN